MATTTKPAPVLSRDQRRRAEALEHARRIILGTVGGPLVVRVANGPCDADDVLRVAGWILDGIAVDVVEDGPVVDGPRPTLETAGVGSASETVLGDTVRVCHRRCVVKGWHLECVDAEGDVLG